MGIFDKIFKTRIKKTVETNIGTFELVFSKKEKNLWSTDFNSIYLTVRGTEIQPDMNSLDFASTIMDEIDQLTDKISIKFKNEFKDAGFEVNFQNWPERFKLVAAEVMIIIQNEPYWNITFEDLESPFAQFTLFIEGKTINRDFAIDT
jgi:hypothetical protein